MYYNKEIIVETKICLKNLLDHDPSTTNNNNKKISKILQNEDAIGKLENQEL
jgi:hypothetical protein